MKKDIVVFLGPSLSLAEARGLIDAQYEPPAKPGDIHRVLAQKPRVILIVDGDQHAGVCRHKEILFALHQGVQVWGAAGLGATRAAELKNFGMRGFGQVYEWYLQQAPQIDSHEVMCAYSYANGMYNLSSQSLVRWRFKMARKVHFETENWIAKLQSTYYQQRNVQNIPELTAYDDIDYDVQRNDTISVLNHLRTYADSYAHSQDTQLVDTRSPKDRDFPGATLFFHRQLLAAQKAGATKIMATLADMLRVAAEWTLSRQLLEDSNLVNVRLNEQLKNWLNDDENSDAQFEFYKVALAQALHPNGSYFLKMKPSGSAMSPIELQNLRAIEIMARIWRYLDEKMGLAKSFTDEMLVAQRIDFLQEMGLFDARAFVQWQVTNVSPYSIESILTQLMPLKQLLNPTLRLECLLQGEMRLQHENWLAVARRCLNPKIFPSTLIEL